MENILLVAKQVGVLFALIAAGAAARKARIVDVKSVPALVGILLYIVTPCVVIDAFSRPCDPSKLKSLAVAFAVAAAFHAASIALVRVLFRRRGENIRPVLALAVVFSNAGFMGIPLEHAILGPDGVFYGTAYVAVFNIFIWTWGYSTMHGGGGPRDAKRTLSALVNPGTAGLAAGLPLFLFSIPLPDVVSSAVGHLAAMNTPLAMIVVGYYLAGARVGDIAKSRDFPLVALLRLIALPVAFTFSMLLLPRGLDRAMPLALAIAASAPVAAMVTMFSSRFSRDAGLSVALVSGTTLASIATMPPITALAMSLFGGV